jgi:hypothetical protein
LRVASEWFESTRIVLGEKAVRKLCCYENLELVFCVSTQEATTWGSELIKTARDFLESEHRGYVLSARLGKGCVSEASVESI